MKQVIQQVAIFHHVISPRSVDDGWWLNVRPCEEELEFNQAKLVSNCVVGPWKDSLCFMDLYFCELGIAMFQWDFIIPGRAIFVGNFQCSSMGADPNVWSTHGKARNHHRRKLRRQISDNMANGYMKSREESQKRKSKKRKWEKVRRQKMQVREKVGKSRNTVCFQCFLAPNIRKVGSLKRRSTVGSWSTFGSCDVKKVHAVVARSKWVTGVFRGVGCR